VGNQSGRPVEGLVGADEHRQRVLPAVELVAQLLLDLLPQAHWVASARVTVGQRSHTACQASSTADMPVSDRSSAASSLRRMWSCASGLPPPAVMASWPMASAVASQASSQAATYRSSRSAALSSVT